MEEVVGLPGVNPANQRAFRIAENQIAVVQITRGQPTENVSPMKVCAWLVDDDGDPILVDGVPVRCPAQIVSLWNAGLAEGAITVQGEMAKATVIAIERLKNHYAAMLAWARLPQDADGQ